MKVKVIFEPEPDSPNLTFVEVEDMEGNSVSVGEWLPKDDRGYGALVLELEEPEGRPRTANHKSLDFTPGPWYVGAAIRHGLPGDPPITEVYNYEMFGDTNREYVVAHVFEGEATAALIAAAPELLEACLRARIAIHDVLECGLIRTYTDDEMAVDELLDAAIARATGEAENDQA